MSHLRDRMPQRIIKVAGCDVSSMNMRKNPPRRHSRQRSRHRLDPIPQHNHDVTFGAVKKPGNAAHPARQTLRLVARRVAAPLHPNPRWNGCACGHYQSRSNPVNAEWLLKQSIVRDIIDNHDIRKPSGNPGTLLA